MPTLMAGDIELFLRCPRLLAYQRQGREEASRVGGASPERTTAGLLTERVVWPFHREMADGKSETHRQVVELLSKPSGERREGLLALIRERWLDALLVAEAGRLTVEQRANLERAWSWWVAGLADRLDRIWPEAAKVTAAQVAGSFLDPDREMAISQVLRSGKRVTVVSRYGPMVYDPGCREVLVALFMANRLLLEEQELLRMVLAGWLAREAVNAQPEVVVYYLDDDQRPATQLTPEDWGVASGQLPDLFEQVQQAWEAKPFLDRPPPASGLHLCRRCSLVVGCDRDWGSRQEEERPVSERPLTPQEELDGLLPQLLAALEAFKVPASTDGRLIGPRVFRIGLLPWVHRGVLGHHVAQQAANIQVRLELSRVPLVREEAGKVWIDLPRRCPAVPTLAEMWRQGRKGRPESPWAFPLGVGMDGRVVWGDLGDPGTDGALLVGSEESGKAVFLLGALLTWLEGASPREVNFTLIDRANSCMGELAGLPHFCHPVVTEVEQAVEVLAEMAEVVDGRLHRFAKAGVTDWRAYGRLVAPICRQVVIVNEFGDLLEGSGKAKADAALRRIGRKGPQAGVHLFWSTGRFESRILTPQRRDLVPLKVVFQVPNARVSTLLLAEGGGESLLEDGDLLVGGSLPLQRLQAPRITQKDLERVRAKVQAKPG